MKTAAKDIVLARTDESLSKIASDDSTVYEFICTTESLMQVKNVSVQFNNTFCMQIDFVCVPFFSTY